MGYDNYIEDQYEVPFLAKILHSLPHLNITLHRTNNTFRPTDEIYLEVRLHFFLHFVVSKDFFFNYRVWVYWDQSRRQLS